MSTYIKLAVSADLLAGGICLKSQTNYPKRVIRIIQKGLAFQNLSFLVHLPSEFLSLMEVIFHLLYFIHA